MSIFRIVIIIMIVLAVIFNLIAFIADKIMKKKIDKLAKKYAKE